MNHRFENQDIVDPILMNLDNIETMQIYVPRWINFTEINWWPKKMQFSILISRTFDGGVGD